MPVIIYVPISLLISFSDIPLRKLIVRLLNLVLDTNQNRCLPLVQLANLVKLVQSIGELLLALGLDGLAQVSQKLVLSLSAKRRIHVAVLFEGPLRSYQVAAGKVADASLEEIVLDAVFHKVVVDGLLGHLLVFLDGLVVVALDGSHVGDLEPQFVG
ncbi:hypothetical protein HG530_015678 [Fusarium avenaceum]|nr:hypothetical protein HG530_015678 [Fusarium avenaceum]